MVTTNKNKLLTLSVSIISLTPASISVAEEVVPTPSLKPASLKFEQFGTLSSANIPTPTLKPEITENPKGLLFSNAGVPAPSLKPHFSSEQKFVAVQSSAAPAPSLKPFRKKPQEMVLMAGVEAPIPSRKPPPPGKQYKKLYTQARLEESIGNRQLSSSNTGKSYDASFFKKYAPVTAADMVAQVPNFALIELDSKRGLGQGGVNVLINGVRLTGKDNDARSALTRMPAASVARIEILNGASLNIPGLGGTVANIVTNQNKTSGSWKYFAEFQDRSRANLFGIEASVSGSRGPVEYNIGFESGPFRDTETGPELITNGFGDVIERRDELALAFEDNPKISAEFSYLPDNGHVAHLNANYQVTNYRLEEASLQTAITSAGDNGERLTSFGEDGWNGELGGDYAFDVGEGNLKLIGITRQSDIDLKDTFRTFDFNGNDTTEVFTQSTQSGETIARGEYSFKQDETMDWQFAVEGALNFLETEATLGELAEDGSIIDIPLPGSSSRVEEKRIESNITGNWKASEKLSLQASAGVEFSELSQTGPFGLTREFVRPKGFVSTSYAASDTLNIRTKVERTVGQLDFDTFISSVSLADDLANAGNPEIVPAQSWDGEIELEKSWSNGVSGTLKLYGQKIEDVVDRIPLPNGGDAPGNIDSAEVLGVELIGTVLMDDFGLEGARVDVELAAENSSVADAVTGLDRRLSEGLVSSYTIDFRHDIPNTNWAWGGDVVGNRDSANFRLNQISHFTESAPEVGVFLEHKDIRGLTLRFDVRNALSAETKNIRNLFDGDNRRVGSFSGSESRVRTAAPRYGITLSGTF
ncbi:MAG: hypothetical protein HKO02_14225 [Hyphomonadaceae bacterium]|nr:hypothetical protein [Hyphomonadaceae bacterium]